MCIVDLKPKTFQSHLVTSAIQCSGKKKKKKDVNDRAKFGRLHDKFIKTFSDRIFPSLCGETLYIAGIVWLVGCRCLWGFGGQGWFLFCFGVCCFLVVWVRDFRKK